VKTRPNPFARRITTYCLAAACLWAVGVFAGEPPADEASQPAPAAEEKPAPAAEEKPAAEQPDLFQVPEGTPEELLAYIEKLKKARPNVTDYESFVEFRDKVAKALLGASEKILAGKPTDEQRAEAVHTKLIALSILAQSGNAEAEAALAKLPEQLTKAGYAELARDATAMILQTRFQVAKQAGGEEFGKLVEELKKFLEAGPIGRREAGLVMKAVQSLDAIDDKKAAAKIYEDLGNLLAGNEDEAVASFGTRLKGSARRLTLVGEKMVVKGVTLGGEPFDWSKYSGKVVLVDFWATWCGPCIAELPNILQEYADYHERGFDVVGISLDEDRERLVSFVEEREIPWTTLFDDAADESMADYYGVFGIPTTILVGADGNVVSLDARGPALGRHLEKLLGPVEPKQADEPAEKDEPSATPGS
jgi:thiol-disulfide isomerase/thioredoxin